MTEPREDLVRRASALLADHGELGAQTRLRSDGESAEQVAAAIEQVRLRARAATKFGAAAARMRFTADGLEQATTAVVAGHRAERMATYLRGHDAGHVADLCCGIGGDLIALAGAGLQVSGFDSDPRTAAIAAANLAALGLPGETVCTDVRDVDLSGDRFAAFVIDPARRGQRGRTFDLSRYRPDWGFVTGLLDRHTGVAKVAPGIPHDALTADVDAEWVSTPDGLKEAALWSGGLRDQTRRRATVLFGRPTPTDDPDVGAGPARSASISANDPTDDAVAAPGRYLFDPDPAVVRAGLVTGLAARLAAWRIDPQIAYLSGDTHPATPFADAFEVLDVVRPREVRGYLRAARPASLEIKVRGVDLDPATQRRRLLAGVRPRDGAEPLTAFYTRIGERHPVIVARRLTDRGDRESAAAVGR